jgi:hypothetical protein
VKAAEFLLMEVVDGTVFESSPESMFVAKSANSWIFEDKCPC